MYGCESWTVKKAEHWRIDAFELWCWRRLLRVPWTARRSNQSILKDINPKHSLEGQVLKLKLQYFGHLMWRLIGLTHWKRPWCWKDWRQEKKGMTEDGMGGWHRWFDGHEFEQSPGIGDGQGSLACCSPRSCKESDMTEWRHCTELNCAQPYQMEEPLKVHPCLPRFKQRQGLRFKWFFYICITPLTSLELIILFFWVSFYLPDCWSGILWNANSAQKKKVI